MPDDERYLGGDESLRCSNRLATVAGIVDGNEPQLLTEDPTGSVEIGDGHFDALLLLLALIRIGTRQSSRHADQDFRVR